MQENKIKAKETERIGYVLEISYYCAFKGGIA